MNRLQRLACGLSLLLCLPAALFGQKGETPALVVQAAHSLPVTAVAFSPDSAGSLTATASSDQTIKIWHTRTGQLLHTLTGHNEQVTAIAFSHDGKTLVSSSHDRTVRVWDAVTGKLHRTITWHKSMLDAVACSPKEKVLACGGGGSIITLHDFGPGGGKADVHDLRGHTAGINCLAFHPNGRILASGSQDKSIKLWNLNTNKLIDTYNGHGNVLALAFSPDGKILASSSDDKTIRIWAVDHGTKAAAVTMSLKDTLKPSGQINALAFGSPSNILASGGQDHNIDLWDLTSGKHTPLMKKPGPAPIRSLDFSTDGKMLISAGAGNGARLWEVAAAKVTARSHSRLTGLADRVYSLAYSGDGKSLASGMGDSIALWHLGLNSWMQIVPGHKDKVTAVAFNPDSTILASGSGNKDKSIQLWDGHTGKHLKGIPAHSAEVTGVAFSPDGKTLASTGSDRYLHLWNMPAGTHRDSYTGKEQFFCVAYSPDGKYVAAGTLGSVLLFDAKKLKLLQTLELAERVYSVAFSADSQTVAGGNQFGYIRLWDPTTGKPKHMLHPFKETKESKDKDVHEVRFRDVFALAFHPDGKFLVSGGNDKIVRVWDLTKYTEVRTLHDHGRTVKSVAFSKDGKTLASGSGDGHAWSNGDGAIKLWSFKDQPPRAELCTLLGFGDRAWVVVDRQGRYDAQHAGEVDWLHFVIDNEPVELRQLKEKYYEPRLLAKLLGYNSEPVRSVGALKDTKLSPQATVRSFDSKKKQMTVDLTNRDGGMGKVQVLVNGKEVIADARPEKFDPKDGKAELTIDLSKGFFRGKDDKVQIVTWNEKGDLSGRGLVRDVDDAPAAAKPEPKLYAIVVGTSKYANDKLDLRYAAKDAEDFAKALRIGSERHFGKDNVVMSLLSTSGKPAPEQLPTRENLRKAFENVAKVARPDDVLIVFLAGHGLSLTDGEDDLYCYMTCDADTMDLKALAEPKFRQARTVSSKDLTEWIKQVPALQQVMILDTCAAGAAAAKLVDVPSGQIRAMEKLKDKTGFHVLMGCSADRVSYESAAIEHGLLTYALLEGMSQQAKTKTKVMSLFLHAAERVPEMASKFKGFQHPLISSPGTRTMSAAQLNFILGDFKEGDIALRPEKK